MSMNYFKINCLLSLLGFTVNIEDIKDEVALMWISKEYNKHLQNISGEHKVLKMCYFV